MGLISQRPVELSDTVISQCTNILIFKINHPVDVEYIRKMVPNITDEIIEKQKSLQPGTCLGFGLGFKIPIIVKMEMPNPSPLSSNCDVVRIWNGSGNGVPAPQPQQAPTPAVIPDFSAPTQAPAPVAVSEPVVQAVPQVSMPEDSVQSLMQTMTQKPNLIDIVENVEAPADPVATQLVQAPVAEQPAPIVSAQQPVVELQSTPVSVPTDTVVMPTQVTSILEDNDNANFAGIPEMGGFDKNGVAVGSQNLVPTSNVASADPAAAGLINLTTEAVQ